MKPAPSSVIAHVGVSPPRGWATLGLLAFGAAWLATLGTRSLISADEGRYAALAWQMLTSGDWVTPRLNGILYFEKPPLQYWGGALSMGLFGINEFAARLWPGLAGLATVGLVGFTATRLWGTIAGWHALLLAGSTSWIVLNSHFLTLDAGLTAALTLVLCGVLIAERAGAARSEQRRWMLAAWLGMALAVLSKGLIGILIPGAVLILHSAWRRDLAVWRHLQWGAGAALLLVLTLPWFVLVSVRNPDFAWFFFVHEHFQRYLTTSAHREGAWWYFVPYLLIGFLPWTSALPWLLRPRRDDFATSLLWVWVAFVFVFFSLSSSKLPSYILPLFPALALLLAQRIHAVGASVLRRHLALPAAAWAVALWFAPFAHRLASEATPRPALDALALGAGIGALLFLAGAAWAWWLLGRGQRSAALAVVAAAHFAALLIVMQSHDRFGQLKSSAAIARALAPVIDASTPVYAVRSYDQTLPFYLRRTVVLVDYRDEFEFGEGLEPGRWIPTLDAFVARWRRESRAAAYLGPDTFEALRRIDLPMRVLYRDARRVVVVRP